MNETFLSQIDEPRLVEAIRLAELRSRGEIRIHITDKPVEDVVKEAASIFERLGMTATAERNGVLIFVAPESHNFAVLADSGVTEVVGTGPLDAIASVIASSFRDGRFTEGLVAAVTAAADILAQWFPRTEGLSDADELSNEISRG